jgi:hypothetical protein
MQEAYMDGRIKLFFLSIQAALMDSKVKLLFQCVENEEIAGNIFATWIAEKNIFSMQGK